MCCSLCILLVSCCLSGLYEVDCHWRSFLPWLFIYRIFPDVVRSSFWNILFLCELSIKGLLIFHVCSSTLHAGICLLLYFLGRLSLVLIVFWYFWQKHRFVMTLWSFMFEAPLSARLYYKTLSTFPGSKELSLVSIVDILDTNRFIMSLCGFDINISAKKQFSPRPPLQTQEPMNFILFDVPLPSFTNCFRFVDLTSFSVMGGKIQRPCTASHVWTLALLSCCGSRACILARKRYFRVHLWANVDDGTAYRHVETNASQLQHYGRFCVQGEREWSIERKLCLLTFAIICFGHSMNMLLN